MLSVDQFHATNNSIHILPSSSFVSHPVVRRYKYTYTKFPAASLVKSELIRL